MRESDKPCTFLVYGEDRCPTYVSGIKCDLKHANAGVKARALKQALAVIIDGDTSHFRDLPAIIVRYVLPCTDLKVKKLVLLYLETVYKGHDIYGRVPPDMDLVSDYLCQNLEHRDEYIRGLTLRFISRIAARHDLLEPVVEFVHLNLYHRHSFVRRHAYSAVFAIYQKPKMPDGRQLLPDTLDDVADRLSLERDAAAMRNAFLMLCSFAQERAVAYLLAADADDRVVTAWPDIVQVVAITLIRHACWSGSRHRGNLIRIAISLSARSNSISVIYEAADALLSICSDEQVAVCAATSAYLKLLSWPLIDEDEKRIVLDRLLGLSSKLSNLVHKYVQPQDGQQSIEYGSEICSA